MLPRYLSSMVWWLLTALARAGDFSGERMRWDISYAGMVAGEAWADAKVSSSGALVLTGGAKNAEWYEPFYTIDDWVRSTWVPGAGSVRYETRFREGGFHQDQDMHLGRDGIEVWRKQRKADGWKESTSHYPASPAAEDPVSAMYALRELEGDGPWTFPVFSGKKTWPLTVTPVEKTTSDTIFGKDTPVVVVELQTLHEGDLEQKGRFFVTLTDEPRRVPVKVLIRTNFGPIKAELVSYEAGRPPG
jgi:hypothetical protein